MKSPSKVQKSVLSNGVTVLVDSDKRFESASYVVCLSGGLRSENTESVGISHFLEHLLFKRTKKRAQFELAVQIDRLGGEINAFTDADSLCLHGEVSKQSLESLMDFFAELLLEPAFTASDMEVEREVIRQEILEAEDDPDSVVYNEFARRFWEGHILSYPVYGNLEVLDRVSLEDLREKLSELLVGRRLIVAASGNVEPEQILAHAEKCFGKLEAGDRLTLSEPTTSAGHYVVSKPIGQVHLALGRPWPAELDSDYLAGLVVSSVLGDGMSSRLFQVLREQHGLAYDVGAGVDEHQDTAAMIVTAVVEKSNLDKTLQLILDEIRKMSEDRISAEELDRFVSQHQASLMMERDSLSSRVWRAVSSESVHQRYISCEEIVERLSNLTLLKATEVIERWLEPAGSLLVIGGDVEGVELSDAVTAVCAVNKQKPN